VHPSAHAGGVHTTRDSVAELERRKSSSFFNLAQSLRKVLADDWPDEDDENFVAVPRRGLESEIAELLLLEELVVQRDAGDKFAAQLVAHVEEETEVPIAQAIQAQRSRLKILLEENRLMHAEVVARAELRGRIQGDNSPVADSASSVTSSAAGSAAPSAASASANSSSVVAPAEDSLIPSEPEVLASRESSLAAASVFWTNSTEFRSLESVVSAGRVKYRSIVKVALSFLHSLQPISVNRGGGSHVVFHFSKAHPVTLVMPHSGSSKDGTVGPGYHTRLFETLQLAALQQFGWQDPAAPPLSNQQSRLQSTAQASAAVAQD
jgi:hypothetical protein